MSAAPSIPAAFAGAVLDIHGVSDLRARPPVHQLTSASPDARDTPDDTFGDGTHGIAPEDFATIYGVDKLYAAGIDGAGAKIAIIGQTYYVPGDIATFRQDVALPPAKIAGRPGAGHGRRRLPGRYRQRRRGRAGFSTGRAPSRRTRPSCSSTPAPTAATRMTRGPTRSTRPWRPSSARATGSARGSSPRRTRRARRAWRSRRTRKESPSS